MVNNTNKKNHKKELVAKCDQSKEVVANSCLDKRPVGPSGDHPEEVVANCDNLQETNLSQYDIEKLIVTVRGEQVLIDQDIARLYGVTTKRLNQQAKRNIERFPESFRFELTKEEVGEVVANCDHLQSLKFRPTLPYAFTEQGIGQLSSVVHSKIAIERSITIMNAFVAMRRFMVQNAGILMRIAQLEKHQFETDQKMDVLFDRMDKQSPKLLPEQIFATGCVWDAWTYVSDLVRSAKQRIVLIDNYVDDRVLSLLDKRVDDVEATIYSRYYEPFLVDLKKHNEQYREIKFIQLPQRNHDRFLIIDDDVYLLGASVKDMGAGMCAVTKMEVSSETVLQLLK
ncbi:ORF6N domain-containing protein [Prevotella communis]|uniref:ORF6N domain-containing protein n=1 Tax=Prevotella communis TaxID=2913614 RepID=UPI001ED9CA6E|nr:ORF6N domain-containing protein [Prevotella communis]UKK57358.1 ORF6N domain-containing protein [Prevotella communis]